MSDTGTRQKLAAILAADAAGYSRLMAGDERATVAALDAARKVFRSQIESHQGKVIDMAGDSVLASFETATGAVTAALAIQGELASVASGTAEDRRMRFRIGVHLGDVIEKADGTIYGDGVNIAARLQALAEPGGVMVSGMVQEAVRDHVPAAFDDRGTHEVKNIARPVHAFRVKAGAAETPRRLRPRIAGAIAFLLAVGIGGWIATTDFVWNSAARLASIFATKPAQKPIARATIAVLPFVNQSGDPKREYFSEGVTEDIIHALGRFSGVMVSSRNAVQVYKGRTVTPVEISRELGVRYIAQGSVREAGGTLRVSVELSDAEKGAQLWAERYDGAGDQVFEIQDRIVKNIVGALAVKLTRIEQQRVFSKPTESLEAYDLALRARSLIELHERAANREARALLARAQKLAPEYGEILVSLAEAEFQRGIYGWVEDATESMRRAEELGKRALSSTDERVHARAHALMSAIYGHQDRFDEALSHAERAIQLNASDSMAISRRGTALLYFGRIDEAIASLELARRFDPLAVLGLNLAIAYYVAGRHRDALSQADISLARAPHHVALNAIRAAALAELGNAAEARKAADQVRRFSPLFEVENFGTRFVNKDLSVRLQAGLRKAGL